MTQRTYCMAFWRRKATAFCVVSVFLLVCCLTALGQGYSLHWKANRIGVAFADPTLNTAAKNAIVSDIQYCIGGWGANAEIRMRSKGTSISYVYYGTINPYYRDEMDFPKNIIIDPATSAPALQVPQTLSDAYTNALAFAAANASIVTAAHEFISFVSSSNFVSISSNSMPNYIIYSHPSATSNMIVSLAPQIISDLRYQTYFQPSVLGFYYSDQGPAATNLWMQIPCTTQPSYMPSPMWSGFPAIWHDGRWKFCIWGDWIPWHSEPMTWRLCVRKRPVI